ncbi:hypothetical protein [Leptothoe spongobia]|uniref:Uncharacterized protein n=1 Tax=Leptothoe spongobia TAU-MAC 1115 TaxID=1967444 RepID=A0A947GGY8_9CYAN|nr:hypothetical protein [Leptothoe spongobia]MBT9314383.1 hypothetical protein [Leptothoe spongobia TAU-MAC 1115]
MGWIVAFYADEADSNTSVAGVWDGDEVVLLADVADLPTLLNSAEFIAEAAGNDINSARAIEGDFQQRFTDYDVRTVKAQQTITLV